MMNMSKCVRCKKQVEWRLYDNEQERPPRYDDCTSMCENCQFLVGLQEVNPFIDIEEYRPLATWTARFERSLVTHKPIDSRSLVRLEIIDKKEWKIIDELKERWNKSNIRMDAT